MRLRTSKDKWTISRRALNASLLISFINLGVADAFLGPALAHLTNRWGVALADGGILFTMLFSGSCLAVLATSKLLDRLGLQMVLGISSLLLAVGLIGMAFAPTLGIAIIVSLVLGLGVGGLAVALNLLTAALYPATPNVALNMVNVLFGAGALIAPLLVGATNGIPSGFEVATFALGVVALLTTLGFTLLPLPGQYTQGAEVVQAPALRTLLRDRYVFILTITFFLYVGAEVGFGGWVYSFATSGAHLDVGGATLIVDAFWLSFTLGRIGASLVARFITARTMVIGGAALSAGGGLVVALFNFSPVLLFIGAVLVGVGCAPVFPTSFALATMYRSDWAASASSIGVLGGTLGAAILPFIQGQVLAYWGVAAGASFTVLLLLTIVGLQLGGRPAPLQAPTH